MHEFSIVSNIISIVCDVARKEGLEEVKKVSLLIGDMRQIVPDTMEFAFKIATDETIAKGAELDMEFVPVRIKCKSCGGSFEIENNVFHCPKCLGFDIEIVEGQELMIKSIEGEKKDGN